VSIAIIAGSRRRYPDAKIAELCKEYEPTILIHGGDRGTDQAAAEVVSNRSDLHLTEIAVHLNDKAFGMEKAIVHRNKLVVQTAMGLARMLEVSVVCFAFPHSQGNITQDLIKRCEASDIPIVTVGEDDN